MPRMIDMAEFKSKFNIGQWVKAHLPKKDDYTFGTIYAVTFYDDETVYGIQNSAGPDGHFLIPESKVEAA